MYIQEKIKAIPEKIYGIVKKYPVELGLFLYIFILFALARENVIGDASSGVLAPLFIAVAYAGNHLFSKKYRYLYYICWLPLIPLSFLDVWKAWSESSQFFITLAVLSPLAVLLCRRRKDNGKFIGDLLKYIYSGIISAFMAAVALAMFLAIFFSIVYIFKIMEGDIIRNAVLQYASMSACTLLFPALFFAVSDQVFASEIKGSRVIDIVINYIITPALLIYTVILYLYFIQILLLWELPEGGIAYLVFGFTILAIVIKALQLFVTQRRYDWYFTNFSLISFPAIAMFWTGTGRRIAEYGFTDMRVYLVICGIIMTGCILLFLNRRLGRYIYVCALTFILFAGTAYIPYFSADRIALRSQKNRAYFYAARTGLLDAGEKINLQPRPQPDTIYAKDYYRLYASLKYLYQKDRDGLTGLGLNTPDDLLAIVPRDIQYYVQYGTEDAEDHYSKYIYIERDHSGFEMNDLSGYKKLFMPSGSGKEEGVYSEYRNDTLKIFNKDTLLFSMNGKELVERQLNNVRYSLDNLPPSGTLPADLSDQILIFRNDSLLLQMTRIYIYRKDTRAEVRNIDTGLLLMK